MQLEQTDVVVVGGGIAGVATAFALRERGFDVVLLEQRFLAFGASGRSLGGIWTHELTTPEHVDDMRATYALYDRLEGQYGLKADFSRVGGVVFAETDAELNRLSEVVEHQRGLGLSAELVTSADIRSASAFVPASAIGGAVFPDTARVNLAGLVRSFGTIATQLGVRTYEHTPVVRVLRHGDDAIGVLTTRGEVHASAVVWAAGPWTQQLVPDGVDLPLDVVRVGMLQTQPSTLISSRMAKSAAGLLGGQAGARLRLDETFEQTADGRIVVGSTFDRAGSLNPHLTADAAAHLIGSFNRRLPELGNLGVTGLWAGLVGMTVDEYPIVDHVGGLFVNAGHTNGALTAPIAGEHVARLIAGESTVQDLTRFSVSRPTLQPIATTLT